MIKKNTLTLFLLSICIIIVSSDKIMIIDSVMLDPVNLKPYMFTKQITGAVNVMIPTKQNINIKGTVTSQQYIIQMVKTKQQILPKDCWNQTTIYAYAGRTQNGYKAQFPGPAILAKKDVPIKVTWRNNIQGSHILPVDYSYPFINDLTFKNYVPVVPHVHGVATTTSSDGQPEAYWTYNGIKSSLYKTQEACAANQAVYKYPNEQQAGNNWFHDHAFGITRLNVYAGMAGLYKIIDSSNVYETYLTTKYGPQVFQNQTKFLIVTDKTFKNNGQLFYPQTAENPSFSSWNPQFFGNTILVNGVIWPKMNLKKGKFRFVFLNACQSRFLNFYFQNSNKRVPFDLIRIDSDYYDKPITVTQFFASLASRIQFIIDFSKITGEVMMKNNAQAPYPSGMPQALVPEFTGQIMKIIVSNQLNSGYTDSIPDQLAAFKEIALKKLQQITPFPFFKEGQKVFATLFEVENANGDIDSIFIDGTSMENGMSCKNSTYKIGKTYDFYIINLTPDFHPIHFHLINMQKVKQYKINVDAYKSKYFTINGGVPDKYGFPKPPIQLDPQQFRLGPDEYPKDYERIFRDTIQVQSEYVTVFRIKFAKNDGSSFKNINLAGQRFVWHCHILDHEDNQMMKYFCLQ